TLTDLALERGASLSPEKNNRHPGQAKREPGSFQTEVSVFYDPVSAAHRSAAGHPRNKQRPQRLAGPGQARP
ncbi:MAG: hypothetical protein WB610_08960, partial [Rhodomicrobium sp.]